MKQAVLNIASIQIQSQSLLYHLDVFKNRRANSDIYSYSSYSFKVPGSAK